MFKQIKYKVVFKRGNDIEIHLVTRLDLSEMGVTNAYFEVEVDADRTQEEIEMGDAPKRVMKEVRVPVDHVGVVLQEFTTKFDKVGIAIYSGDIIKSGDNHYLISFFEGGFFAINELHEKCIPLSESFCKDAEYAGTIFTTPELIQKPIDESIFTPNETETNEQ